MAHQPLSPPPGFADLSRDEQLRYVEALLEVIDGAETGVVLDDERKQLLQDRLARHRTHPEEALAWEDVRAELAREFG